jgi:hypothetical protein
LEAPYTEAGGVCEGSKYCVLFGLVTVNAGIPLAAWYACVDNVAWLAFGVK